jgi:GNAT superfamily N-acetyltransferase
MTPWDGRRRPLPGALEIRALEPARGRDFFGFFDREAFPDNPMWASCYCLFHEFKGDLRDWGKRTDAENRAEKAELVRSGRARGCLAYAGGRVVGWCHAAPRAELPGLRREPSVDEARVGSIVCFVVAPPYRGSGVARQLLDAACDGFRREGFAFAEGYPRRGADSAAHAYHGPLEMYLAAGFAIAREADRVVVVRRAL